MQWQHGAPRVVDDAAHRDKGTRGSEDQINHAREFEQGTVRSEAHRGDGMAGADQSQLDHPPADEHVVPVSSPAIAASPSQRLLQGRYIRVITVHHRAVGMRLVLRGNQPVRRCVLGHTEFPRGPAV